MILIGDLGNTHSKFSLYEYKKIKHIKSFETYKLLKKKKFIKFINNPKIKHVIVSSVVPKVFKELTFFFSRRGINCSEILNYKIKKLINIKVKKPKQVGSDRIANSIAAHRIYNSNCIIIDFGTATTFDILLKNGSYLGGLITPGVKLALKNLNKFTAKLPLVKLKKTNQVIGKDTISAINSGIYWGYIGMINEIVKKIISSTKKKYRVILTGGLSNVFSKSLYCKSSVNKNITLLGVVEIVKHNMKFFKYEK